MTNNPSECLHSDIVLQVLLTETSESFVWLSGTSSGSRANAQFLENGDALWWSERSGYGHLYRVSAMDNSISPLTSGFWTVDAVVGLDESAAGGMGKVWFTAVGREESSVGCDPYYKQLYSVNLDGTGFTLLTEAADRKWMDHALQMASPSPTGGTTPLDTLLAPLPGADGSLSPSRRFLLDEISSVDTPPMVVVRDADSGSIVRVLEFADISGLTKHVAPHALPPPLPFVTVAADGKTAIHGVIQRPRHFDPEKSYPVVDTCYPGPQVGRATRRFMDVYFHKPSGWGGQALAELGFVIVTLDDTGTPLRSKDFHSARYGQPDSMSGRLEDHIAAITQLADEYPWIDVDRVGITGASGGGLASTRAILQFPVRIGSSTSRAQCPPICLPSTPTTQPG
jgi:dipeptidyl-peptidase-4